MAGHAWPAPAPIHSGHRSVHQLEVAGRRAHRQSPLAESTDRRVSERNRPGPEGRGAGVPSKRQALRDNGGPPPCFKCQPEKNVFSGGDCHFALRRPHRGYSLMQIRLRESGKVERPLFCSFRRSSIRKTVRTIHLFAQGQNEAIRPQVHRSWLLEWRNFASRIACRTSRPRRRSIPHALLSC